MHKLWTWEKLLEKLKRGDLCSRNLVGEEEKDTRVG